MQNEELDLLILSVKSGAGDEFTQYFKRRIEERLAETSKPVTVAEAIAPMLHSQEQIQRPTDVIEKAPKRPAEVIELIDGVNGRFEALNLSEEPVSGFTRLPTSDDRACDRTLAALSKDRFSINLSDADDPVSAALRHYQLRDIATDVLIKAFDVPPDFTDMMAREKLIKGLFFPRQAICALLFFVHKMTLEDVSIACNMKPSSVRTYCTQAAAACGLPAVKFVEWQPQVEKPVRHLAPGLFWPPVPAYLRDKRRPFVLSEVTSSPMFRDLKIVWDYLSKHHPNPHRVDCSAEHFAIGAMFRMYGHSMEAYKTMWQKAGNKAADIFLGPRRLECVFTSKDPDMWPLLRDVAERHNAHETLVGAAALLGKCDDFNG